MYYHEMDVCCSLGREALLREPQHYPVYLVPWGVSHMILCLLSTNSDFRDYVQTTLPSLLQEYDPQATNFTRSMTELAQILRLITEEIPRKVSEDEAYGIAQDYADLVRNPKVLKLLLRHLFGSEAKAANKHDC